MAVASAVALVALACGERLEPVRLTLSADVTNDRQVTCTECNVAFPPSVRVTDASGNGYPGLEVHFLPLDGSTIDSGSVVITDVLGRAQAGPWRLGSTVRTYHAQIALGTSDAIVAQISAKAEQGCPMKAFTHGSVTSGTLSKQSFFDGYSTFMDCYELNIPAGGTQVIGFVTSSSNPNVYGYLGAGASSNGETAIAALRPGGYFMAAQLYYQDTASFYTISTIPNPNISGVCLISVSDDISVTHSLETACVYSSTAPGQLANSRSYKEYRLNYCGPYTIHMSSAAFDPRLEVYAAYGDSLLATANGSVTTPATVTIPDQCVGLSIRATHVVPSAATTPRTGAFTLTIDP
jgi:hypothetical protein